MNKNMNEYEVREEEIQEIVGERQALAQERQ